MQKQSSVNLGPSHVLRQMQDLALQIALPAEAKPLRFPSFPALERTAVMGFNYPTTLSLPANTATAVTVFRQASFPVWAETDTVWLHSADYRARWAVDDYNVGEREIDPTLYNTLAMTNRTATVGRVGITAAGGLSPTAPTFPVLGRDINVPGPEFIFVPYGMSLHVVAGFSGTGPGATNLVVTLEEWISPGQTRVTTTASVTVAIGYYTGISSAIFFTNGTWVRPQKVSIGAGGTPKSVTYVTLVSHSADDITFTASGTNCGTLSLELLSKRAEVPIVYPAEIRNSALPWMSTRVTASAFLGTNVSQVLNKGGTVLGGRVNPCVANAWTVNKEYLNGLHPAEKAFLPLETGVYTYCPPSTDLAEFHDFTVNTSQDVPEGPVFALGNTALYNKMFLTATAIAETLAVTATSHIEFRTSSALFQIGLSPMSLESLHQAQLKLSAQGYFFENPAHRALIMRGIAVIKKYAPRVFKAVAPELYRAFNPTKKRRNKKARRAPQPRQPRVVYPKSGPSRPAATNAVSSGIIAKPNGRKMKSGLQMFLDSRNR